MTNVKTKEEQTKAMVEQMGIFFEQSGMTPMMGRVFAFLLVSDPPHQDFYTIQEFLQASKSAISNALKFLGQENLVNYITFSGDRKRYFKVDLKGWKKSLKEAYRSSEVFSNLITTLLQARIDTKYLAFNEALEDIVAFQTHLSNGIEKLIQEWEEREKGK